MNPAALTPLSLNASTLQVGGGAGWINITDPECKLLKAFATATARRLATPVILELVGKEANELAKRALEVQIARLRKKLEQAGAPAPTIKAIRGVGYQLCIPIAVPAELTSWSTANTARSFG